MKVDTIMLAREINKWADGEVANAVVCKTTIHRFESGSALHNYKTRHTLYGCFSLSPSNLEEYHTGTI